MREEGPRVEGAVAGVIAALAQLGENDAQTGTTSHVQQTRDVFEEEGPGSAVAGDAEDVVIELSSLSRIGKARHGAEHREGLARKPGREYVMRGYGAVRYIPNIAGGKGWAGKISQVGLLGHRV